MSNSTTMQAKLEKFLIREYMPAVNGESESHYAIALRVDDALPKTFIGVNMTGMKKVWQNADDCAVHRNQLEKKFGIGLYILRLYSHGAVEEVSWPKDESATIMTPGAGTW